MTFNDVKPLRVVFMGTPDFSVQALKALIDSHHDVVCVYSQPPRPKGRGKKIQASPVQLTAEAAGIEIKHPLNFKNIKDVDDFKNLNADVAVVAAYGLILPQNILNAPQYGCINIHASLLPRWRGAAPIHRAIWAGDSETGVTLMQMDVGLDTGDMIAKQAIPITSKTILPVLHDDLSAMGARMIVPCLDELSKNKILMAVAQSEEETCYAPMLTKEDGHVDWTQNSVEIDRQVRALNPWPGTWCLDESSKRLKILQSSLLDEKTDKASGVVLEDGKISCGNKTVLQLEKIQPENKKSMDIKVALNGGHITKGDVFS